MIHPQGGEQWVRAQGTNDPEAHGTQQIKCLPGNGQDDVTLNWNTDKPFPWPEISVQARSSTETTMGLKNKSGHRDVCWSLWCVEVEGGGGAAAAGARGVCVGRGRGGGREWGGVL